MTGPSRITEIQARWASTTPTPWVVSSEHFDAVINPELSNGGGHAQDIDRWYGGKVVGESIGPADREAIAHAPDDIEWLLSEVTRLRDLVGRVLGHFHERGHPGAPCIRTGWIGVGTYESWVEEARR